MKLVKKKLLMNAEHPQIKSGFNASLTATLKVTEWVLKGFALENQLL